MTPDEMMEQIADGLPVKGDASPHGKGERHVRRHDGLPVKGYVSQSDESVALVNTNKVNEEKLLRMIDNMECRDEFDQRWLAIARSHIEQGFMALNRSVFKPERVDLEGIEQ